MLSKMLVTGECTKGALMDRVAKSHAPIISAIFGKCSRDSGPVARPSTVQTTVGLDAGQTGDGIIDSLRYLLHHNNYNNPHGTEHKLAALLTKSY